MSDREAAIRKTASSLRTFALVGSSLDLPTPKHTAEQAADALDSLLAELAAAREREAKLREALRDGLTVFADTEWAAAYRHLWEGQGEAGSSAADTSVGERQGRQPASPYPAALIAVVTELARWSRVAERNGDLHARLSSALAAVSAGERARLADGEGMRREEIRALLDVEDAARVRQAIRGPLAETLKERAAAEDALERALNRLTDLRAALADGEGET